MTELKQNLKLILLGTVVIIALVSAGYLWLNTPPQPMACTINQTPGDVIVIDETMNNAVICTKPNNSVTLRLGLYDRVGAVWRISNSSGLLVSEGIKNMPGLPGFGTIEWNVTMIDHGMQSLKANCLQYVSDNRSISTQNLTFVVR